MTDPISLWNALDDVRTSEQAAPCAYPSCDCDGPDGPECGNPKWAEIMNRPELLA